MVVLVSNRYSPLGRRDKLHAAAKIESTLLESSDVAKIEADVHELVEFCLQAQAPVDMQSSAAVG